MNRRDFLATGVAAIAAGCATGKCGGDKGDLAKNLETALNTMKGLI